MFWQTTHRTHASSKNSRSKIARALRYAYAGLLTLCVLSAPKMESKNPYAMTPEESIAWHNITPAQRKEVAQLLIAGDITGGGGNTGGDTFKEKINQDAVTMLQAIDSVGIRLDGEPPQGNAQQRNDLWQKVERAREKTGDVLDIPWNEDAANAAKKSASAVKQKTPRKTAPHLPRVVGTQRKPGVTWRADVLDPPKTGVKLKRQRRATPAAIMAPPSIKPPKDFVSSQASKRKKAVSATQHQKAARAAAHLERLDEVDGKSNAVKKAPRKAKKMTRRPRNEETDHLQARLNRVKNLIFEQNDETDIRGAIGRILEYTYTNNEAHYNGGIIGKESTDINNLFDIFQKLERVMHYISQELPNPPSITDALDKVMGVSTGNDGGIIGKYLTYGTGENLETINKDSSIYAQLDFIRKTLDTPLSDNVSNAIRRIMQTSSPTAGTPPDDGGMIGKGGMMDLDNSLYGKLELVRLYIRNEIIVLNITNALDDVLGFTSDNEGIIGKDDNAHNIDNEMDIYSKLKNGFEKLNELLDGAELFNGGTYSSDVASNEGLTLAKMIAEAEPPTPLKERSVKQFSNNEPKKKASFAKKTKPEDAKAAAPTPVPAPAPADDAQPTTSTEHAADTPSTSAPVHSCKKPPAQRIMPSPKKIAKNYKV